MQNQNTSANFEFYQFTKVHDCYNSKWNKLMIEQILIGNKQSFLQEISR